MDHFTKVMSIHSRGGGGGHELFGVGFSIHHFPSKSPAPLVLGQKRHWEQDVVLTPIMGWLVWMSTSRTKMSSSNVQNSERGWQGGVAGFVDRLKLEIGHSRMVVQRTSSGCRRMGPKHSPSIPEQSQCFKVQFPNLQNLPNGMVSGLNVQMYLKCINVA